MGVYPRTTWGLLFFVRLRSGWLMPGRQARRGYVSCARGGISPLDRLRPGELRANSDIGGRDIRRTKRSYPGPQVCVSSGSHLSSRRERLPGERPHGARGLKGFERMPDIESDRKVSMWIGPNPGSSILVYVLLKSGM